MTIMSRSSTFASQLVRLGRVIPIVLLLVMAASVSRAHAQSATAVSLERGLGDGTGVWRLGLQRDWREWLLTTGWRVMVAWEVQLGRWAPSAAAASTRPIAEVGVTPIVRLVQAQPGRIAAFVEGAVGAHLISRNRVHSELDMSSAYQFGDHIGIGVRLGRAPWMEVVFRHQHLSNASTVPPNDGANFNILRVVYYLR